MTLKGMKKKYKTGRGLIEQKRSPAYPEAKGDYSSKTLDPNDWLIVKNLPEVLQIRKKGTGMIRSIYLGA